MSRRSLLGLAALGLAACKKGSSPPTPRVDPDATALAAARDGELTLIRSCEAVGFTADQNIHTAHFKALGGVFPSAPVMPKLLQTDEIQSAVRGSVASLRGAAVAAIDGDHAARFASIAASHEVMAGE